MIKKLTTWGRAVERRNEDGMRAFLTPNGDKYTAIVSASRDGLTLLAQRPVLSFWDGFRKFFGFPASDALAREVVLIRLRN
jgi:hypothetical protein